MSDSSVEKKSRKKIIVDKRTYMREYMKKYNHEKILNQKTYCDICNITMTKCCFDRHEKSMHHRYMDALKKLDVYKTP